MCNMCGAPLIASTNMKGGGGGHSKLCNVFPYGIPVLLDVNLKTFSV